MHTLIGQRAESRLSALETLVAKLTASLKANGIYIDHSESENQGTIEVPDCGGVFQCVKRRHGKRVHTHEQHADEYFAVTSSQSFNHSLQGVPTVCIIILIWSEIN
jgi:hypothetical protein